jgi:hypothetical protein
MGMDYPNRYRPPDLKKVNLQRCKLANKGYDFESEFSDHSSRISNQEFIILNPMQFLHEDLIDDKQIEIIKKMDGTEDK